MQDAASELTIVEPPTTLDSVPTAGSTPVARLEAKPESLAHA